MYIVSVDRGVGEARGEVREGSVIENTTWSHLYWDQQVRSRNPFDYRAPDARRSKQLTTLDTREIFFFFF